SFTDGRSPRRAASEIHVFGTPQSSAAFSALNRVGECPFSFPFDAAAISSRTTWRICSTISSNGFGVGSLIGNTPTCSSCCKAGGLLWSASITSGPQNIQNGAEVGRRKFVQLAQIPPGQKWLCLLLVFVAQRTSGMNPPV